MSDWKLRSLQDLCERYGLILTGGTGSDELLEVGLREALKKAYADRAQLNWMIARADAALREVSPEYRTIMDALESDKPEDAA